MCSSRPWVQSQPKEKRARNSNKQEKNKTKKERTASLDVESPHAGGGSCCRRLLTSLCYRLLTSLCYRFLTSLLGLLAFFLFRLLFGGDIFSVDISSSELLQNRVTRRRHDVLTGGCRLIPVSAVQSEHRDEESLQEGKALNCREHNFSINSKLVTDPGRSQGSAPQGQ